MTEYEMKLLAERGDLITRGEQIRMRWREEWDMDVLPFLGRQYEQNERDIATLTTLLCGDAYHYCSLAMQLGWKISGIVEQTPEAATAPQPVAPPSHPEVKQDTLFSAPLKTA